MEHLLKNEGRNMDCVRYEVMEDYISTERGEIPTYGILVCPKTDERVPLIEIRDVTLDASALSALVALCNLLELSPLHLRDVIDDFLAK